MVESWRLQVSGKVLWVSHRLLETSQKVLLVSHRLLEVSP